MSKTVLLLGSNLGDRLYFLSSACELIEQRVGAIKRRTTIHQSEPWGYQSSNIYSNQALEIETCAIDPIELLDTLQSIEQELGRIRADKTSESSPRYEDRTIDIDILYIDNLNINHPRLTVPHPRIGERDFVLRLLAELGLDHTL